MNTIDQAARTLCEILVQDVLVARERQSSLSRRALKALEDYEDACVRGILQEPRFSFELDDDDEELDELDAAAPEELPEPEPESEEPQPQTRRWLSDNTDEILLSPPEETWRDLYLTRVKTVLSAIPTTSQPAASALVFDLYDKKASAVFVDLCVADEHHHDFLQKVHAALERVRRV